MIKKAHTTLIGLFIISSLFISFAQDADVDDRDGIRATLKDAIELEPGTV